MQLANWQRKRGTSRVVVAITLFSVVVSAVLCFSVFIILYGSPRQVFDNVGVSGLALTVAAPMLIAPAVSAQLTRALGIASALIEELEEAKSELERMAHHDPLTDLLNRRGFFTAIAALDAEQMSTLVLATADVDRFKTVNDTYGHAAGDHVLVRVAQSLTAAAGPGAIVGRLGGDEFAACVPQASRAVDDIRTALGAIAIPDLGTDSLVVRCSVGIANHDGDRTIDDTLATADLALYEEKHGVGAPGAPVYRRAERT